MPTWERLAAFDTPTVCNALELVDPRRRNFGYTTDSMHVVNPLAGPTIGLARTALIRSVRESDRSSDQLKRDRVAYYRYVAAEDQAAPRVVVMQDADGRNSGRGPFWGEFNTRIHRQLGVIAVVTDGSVRDLRQLPEDLLLLSAGLRPSHANIHVVSFADQVNVFGMYVSHGDLVHADEHGAVSFPVEIADDVFEAANDFVASEAAVITACRTRKLTVDEIVDLYLDRPHVTATADQ